MIPGSLVVLGHQRWQDSRVRLPSAGSEDRRAWGASRRSARSTGALSTAQWEQLPGLISRAMCLALGLVHRNRRALWTGAFTDPENPPHSFGFFSSLWRKAGVKRFMGPQPGPLPALLAIPSALAQSSSLPPSTAKGQGSQGKAARAARPVLWRERRRSPNGQKSSAGSKATSSGDSTPELWTSAPAIRDPPWPEPA